MEFLLTGLPDRKRQMLSRLLPYWGAKMNEQSQITGALAGQSVSVTGLVNDRFRELSQFLKHTNVQLSETNNEADLQIQVQINTTAPAPITLKTNQTTYHLKPLRKPTDNVQLWIHKRLWLPVREPSITFIFHAREEKNIPEWLCYLVMQYFMQSAFEPLTDLEFADYRELTASALRFLNRELADRQLSLDQPIQTAWPEGPPVREPSQKKKTPDTENQLNPFQKRSNRDQGEPFNPFRKQKKPERSTINPFRKKP